MHNVLRDFAHPPEAYGEPVASHGQVFSGRRDAAALNSLVSGVTVSFGPAKAGLVCWALPRAASRTGFRTAPWRRRRRGEASPDPDARTGIICRFRGDRTGDGRSATTGGGCSCLEKRLRTKRHLRNAVRQTTINAAFGILVSRAASVQGSIPRRASTDSMVSGEPLTSLPTSAKEFVYPEFFSANASETGMSNSCQDLLEHSPSRNRSASTLFPGSGAPHQV